MTTEEQLDLFDNYDEEFGPNKVRRCDKCKAKLIEHEICWCVDKECVEDDD